VDPGKIAALSFRSIEKATKNVVLELSDGKRLCILGGRSRRPPSPGAVGFTPREMAILMNSGIDEKGFRGIMRMREMGLAVSIEEIRPAAEKGGPEGSLV